MAAERFLLSQINPCVGDFKGNTQKIINELAWARQNQIGVVLFPEMTVTGYPPEDLLFKSHFIRACQQAIDLIARETNGLLAVVGGVEKAADGRLYNTAFILRNRVLLARYRKMCLPNYGVFDEARYFTPGEAPLIIEHKGIRVAISICEDLWLPQGAYARAFQAGSADLVLNLSASPYELGKGAVRQKVMRFWPKHFQLPVFYTNLVGGQDELVFDGQSFVLNDRGKTVAEAPAFEEARLVVKWPLSRQSASTGPKYDTTGDVYRALVLGVRDYVDKNCFPKVLIGLSGGIDSALVACVAVDALGASRVVGVTMPSDITSSQTLNDAHRLASRLGIEIKETPIRNIYKAYEAALEPAFKGLAAGTAEENIQARIRGTLLMAFSNKFGWLVLTTGNKSETATGYCTLYGDMAGGFAVIKDVPKTLVYRLARHRNKAAKKELIPYSIIRRAPTAELRPGQKDQDTLPAYSQLDRFIEQYVDRDSAASVAQSQSGLSNRETRALVQMIDRNEYKRRQAPPGIKITAKAFGRDRRMPITNRMAFHA